MGNEASQSMELRASSLMTKILLKSEQQVIQHLTQQEIELNRPINQVLFSQTLSQMGDTISHYAAYKSMYRLLDWLINKDANFQTCYNHRKLTPIDVAVPQTREWIYKKLKQYKILKNQKISKAQKTPKLSQKDSIMQSIEPNPFLVNHFQKPSSNDTPAPVNQVEPVHEQRVKSQKHSEKNQNMQMEVQMEVKDEQEPKESIDFASLLFKKQ